MVRISPKHGSAFHLLRHMGRFRNQFDQALLKAIGSGESIKWVDFTCRNQKDCEVEGLSFLPKEQYAKTLAKWKSRWPQSGTQPTWDAVGWLQPANEVILLEAKANVSELSSSRVAKHRVSKEKISRFLRNTIRNIGAQADNKWYKEYYQYANRLAVLDFLHSEGIPARLVYVYFCGDTGPKNKIRPESQEKWQPYLDQVESYLGIQAGHSLKDRVHQVFLPVHPMDIQGG